MLTHALVRARALGRLACVTRLPTWSELKLTGFMLASSLEGAVFTSSIKSKCAPRTEIDHGRRRSARNSRAFRSWRSTRERWCAFASHRCRRLICLSPLHLARGRNESVLSCARRRGDTSVYGNYRHISSFLIFNGIPKILNLLVNIRCHRQKQWRNGFEAVH